MKSARRTGVCLLALASLLSACAGPEQDGAQGRAANPAVPRSGIGPSAAAPPAPKDMPGGGRGGMSPFKGKQ